MADEKLIRDRIPEIARAGGAPILAHTATDDEMPTLARMKLVEEAGEAVMAAPENILGELADVMEAVHLLAHLHGHTVEDIEEARTRKSEEFGSFSRGFVMENVASLHETHDEEWTRRRMMLESLLTRLALGVSTEQENEQLTMLVRQEVQHSQVTRAVAAGNLANFCNVLVDLCDAQKELDRCRAAEEK